MCKNSKLARGIAAAGILAMTMGALAGCGSSQDTGSTTPAAASGDTSPSAEVTTAPTAESNAASDFAYTLEVNGQEYPFPMTYQEMLDRGWVPSGSEEGKITQEEYGEFIIPAGSSGTPSYGGMNLGEIKKAKVLFDNRDGETDRAVKDCEVIGIKFESKKGFPKGSIVLKSATGTVVIGESTEEDITALFDGGWFYDADDGFIFVDRDENGIVDAITFQKN